MNNPAGPPAAWMATQPVPPALKGFAPGTRLLGLNGWTPVENLAVGDLLVTTRHQHRPVRRTIHAAMAAGAPVRITAGAFAPDLPCRDVVLAPDHAVLIEDALVPACLLVNGATILHDPDATMRYHQLELGSPEVVVADGLPVESGRPVGAPGEDPCDALPADPSVIRAARRHLLLRADLLGHTMTQDADLHLRADGRRLWGRVANGIWSGWVPPDTRVLQIASRSAAPADTDPTSDDCRRLGVALKRIVLRSNALSRVLTADATHWGKGFHAAQTDGRVTWRWTNGDACLDRSLWADLATPLRIDLHVLRTQTYRSQCPPTGAPVGLQAAYA